MVGMHADMQKQISLKFQDSEIACRIIATLLKFEREYPSAFGNTLAWIQTLFEKSHLNIGRATVMADNDVRDPKDSTTILNLDDFMALRFLNPETGHQLIITLMELEARIDGVLSEIMVRIEATLEGVISKQGSQGSPTLAKLLPFKGKQNF